MGESVKVQKTITMMVINCFIGLLALVSAVNIFNTIYSNILLRKKDFSVLKSIGMSNKQINKMMILEGIFYGIDSVFFGTVISFIIVFIMYHQMNIDARIYQFDISWIDLGMCICSVYSIIFIAIINAKKKFSNNNIIDEIKDENI